MAGSGTMRFNVHDERLLRPHFAYETKKGPAIAVGHFFRLSLTWSRSSKENHDNEHPEF